MKLPEMAKELGELANKKGDFSSINLLSFLWVAIAIIVFRTASRLLFFLPARYQQRDLRLEIINLLENTHPNNYKNFNDGQIYQITFNDINRIRGFVGFGLLQVGNIIIALYVIIPKVLDFNKDLLISFTPLVSGVVIFSILSMIFQPFDKKNSKAQGEVQNYIIESYNGKSTIKNYHAEKSFFENFIELSKIEMKYFFISSIGPTITIPLIRLTFGASLLWGAYLIKQADMGASSLIYFSGILFLVVEPLAFLSWLGVVFISGYTGWKRVKELANVALKAEPLVTNHNSENNFKIDFWSKSIEVKLNQGLWSVFVGDTGSGKSYILKAIADSLMSNGQKVSMVAQEPYLYNDTIADNIFLGREPSEEDLKHCEKLIKLFGLDVLGTDFNQIINLEVGENGKKVSGGQAKRICLLRSVFANVDYIIWDDPFSSVDLILEKQIVGELKKLPMMENKTVVLSSHRLSTVKNCDHIIYVEKDFGIREQGNTSLLSAKESLVSEYFAKQLV